MMSGLQPAAGPKGRIFLHANAALKSRSSTISFPKTRPFISSWKSGHSWPHKPHKNGPAL